MSTAERDICLIEDGRLHEDAMRRLHINAGELIAKAHERGFDSLDEVESAVLYPNGTIYFRGRTPQRRGPPRASCSAGSMRSTPSSPRSAGSAVTFPPCRPDPPLSSPAPRRASAAPLPSPSAAPAIGSASAPAPPRRSRRVVAELAREGIEAAGAAADVADPEQVERAVAAVVGALGEIGLLVNNAGVLIARPFEELTLEDWDVTMATNLRSLYLVTRAVAARHAAAARGDHHQRGQPRRAQRLRRRHRVLRLQARRARLRRAPSCWS